MKEVLLTSSEFIKSATNISDNVNEKVLSTAIREAQDIELRSVIGSKMLNVLKGMVGDGTIDDEENIKYKELLTETQYFLAYSVLTKLCMITTFKVDNIGISRTTDERIETVGVDDALLIKDFYKKKADYYQMLLQKYILCNRLPEIDDNQCCEIKANLYSAASGGLWLGGIRGKF